MNRDLLPIRAMSGFYYATQAILLPLLPLYLSSRGYSASEVGTFMMIGPLVAVIAQPALGFFSDRYSAKWTMVVLWLLTVLSSIGLFGADGYAETFLFVLLLYFFMLPCNPLLDSISIQAAQKTGKSYGSIRSWGSVGFLVTALLSGLLLPAVGGVGNIKWMYWGLAVLPLLILLSLKEEKGGGIPVTLRSMAALLGNKKLLWFLLIVFVLSVPHRMNDALLGLYLQELDAPPGLVSSAWAFAAFGEAVAFAFFSRYTQRFHELALLGIVALLYALRWGAYALADEPWMLFLLQGSHCVTFGLFWIVSVQYVVRLVPPDMRSTGQSLLSAVFLGLAGITGGSLGGWLQDQWGGTGMYWSGVAFALAAAAMLFLTQAVARTRKSLDTGV